MLHCIAVPFEDARGPNKLSLVNRVGKKWDPGILDPGPFSGQIRKVEARLRKLAKIRKVETD